MRYLYCLGLQNPTKVYFANLNTAQIIGLGSQYGQTINNDQAQSLMNQFGGGNADQLTNYFTQQQTTNTNNTNATNAANQAQTNFTNLSNADDASVTGFLSQYKGDVNNAISTANSTFNLPTLEGAVTGLTNRINDLQNNTSNSGGGAEATTGFGGASSAGQVQSELDNREMPQLNAASANLNTAEGLSQEQIANATAPDVAYGQALSANITAGMSGLSQADQTTLQGYLDVLDQGTALTENENTNAEALAQAVLQNANNITVAQLNNQYKTAASGTTITNENTGQVTNPGVLASTGAYNPPTT